MPAELVAEPVRPGRGRKILAVAVAAGLLIVAGVGLFASGVLNPPALRSVPAPATATPGSDPTTAQPTVGADSDVSVDSFGNYSGNLTHDGLVAPGGDEFYISTSAGVMAYSWDGQQVRTLSDATDASYLNYHDGHLYFRYGQRIHRVDVSTGVDDDIAQSYGFRLFLDGGLLYFEPDAGALREAALDGTLTGRAVTIPDPCDYSAFADGRLFCSGENGGLVSVDFATGATTDTGIPDAKWIACWDGWVYYRTHSEAFDLRRVRPDGTGDQRVSETGYDFFVPTERGVFSKDSDAIGVIALDGSGAFTSIADLPDALVLWVAGDWIVYSAELNGNENMRMVKADGTMDQPVGAGGG